MTLTVTGTCQVGNTLTAVGGATPYQWLCEGEAISGATASTYLLTDDEHGCVVQVVSQGETSDPTVDPVIGSTVRYVSMSTGSDTNDGTTSGTGVHGPWKTLAHVNAQTSTTIPAGTSVLFKRGDTWRTDGCSTSSGCQLSPGVSGTAGKPIVYSAYGTGTAKPIFDGSFDLSATADWTLISGNLWKSAHTFNGLNGGAGNGKPYNGADDVGNLIWSTSAMGGTNVPPALLDGSSGVMKGGGAGGVWFKTGDNQAHLTAAGEWNFNTDTNKVQIYSTTNPATAYPGIRAAIDTTIIFPNNITNSIFQNLTLNYGGGIPVMLFDTVNVIVRDMVIQWGGGGNNGGQSTTDSRYGDGIDIEGSVTTCLVERVWFHQLYDGAVGPQCTSPHQDNVTIRNCVATDLGQFFFEAFLLGTSTASGLWVFNNTIYMTEDCWANRTLQRPNGALDIIAFATSVTAQTSFEIKNNIFAGIGGANGNPGTSTYAIGWWGTSSNPFTSSGDWMDYDCWPKNSHTLGNQQIALQNGNFDLSAWAPGTLTGHTFTPALEANGVLNVDPQFTNQSAFNFALAVGTSPCLLAGRNLYSVTHTVPPGAAKGVVVDYNKKARPSTGNFSIGAFQ